MNSKENELVRLVFEKTKAKDAVWRLVDRSQLVLRMDAGVFTIDRYREETQAGRGEGSMVIHFKLLNRRNQELVSVAVSEVDIDYGLLQDLYNQAMDSYLKVDETLESVIKQLNSPGTVGDADEINVEDIPF